MAKFEKVSRFMNDEEVKLPVRATKTSAGYDLFSAEDVIIPPFAMLQEKMLMKLGEAMEGSEAEKQIKTHINNKDMEKAQQTMSKAMTFDLNDMAELTKQLGTRPTLISTGCKFKLGDNEVAKCYSRSSSPLKYMLMLANSTGIIDSDYYNNEGNEGEVFIQVINMSPVNLRIRKGEAIAQVVISKFISTEDDNAEGKRKGGFGSTTK